MVVNPSPFGLGVWTILGHPEQAKDLKQVRRQTSNGVDRKPNKTTEREEKNAATRVRGRRGGFLSDLRRLGLDLWEFGSAVCDEILGGG